MKTSILKHFLFVSLIYGNLLDGFLPKKYFKNQLWFKTYSLQEILQKNQDITYKILYDKVYFDFSEFTIAPKYPHKGYFDELFLLTIPNGRVQNSNGYFFIDEIFPDEFVRANRYDCLIFVKKIPEENCLKISGKVAVIAQHGAAGGGANYYHTLCEVLGRLALLEMNNIEYDWLYVPTSQKFMIDALELWGIDLNKVISLESEDFYIQADELLVPSFVINTSAGHKHSGNFQHPITLKYVREKLLEKALKKEIDISKFSKKVFITRKDTLTNRRIINEDEVFELFEQKGFVRYNLSALSVIEQILLFYNAEIVVSEQGSGLTNIMFCKPETKIVEIFQFLIDNCFWWISNIFQLQYIPVSTIQVDFNAFADCWDKDLYYLSRCYKSTNVPLDEIRKCLEKI